MAEAKKKTAAKKPAAKKTAAKKTTAPKKAAPKKSAPAKKAPAAKKKAAKKPAGKSWLKMSIAERTAHRRERKRPVLAVLSMLLLTAAAAFFQFCLAGYSFSAVLCIAVALIIGFYTFNKSKAVTRLFTLLLCLVLAAACVTEAFIIKASFGSPDTPCDYLVVLGAKVRSDGPSLSMNNRLDAAYDYLTAHPDSIAIVSGGQGPDEPMTEAQAMYDGLVSRGVAPARIWMEDEATSTWENLQFSLALIEEKTGHRPAQIAVVSSEYHLFRAGLFTKAAGTEFIGVPAETTLPILKVNYFLREVAGVWHYYLLGGNYHA